MASSRPGFGGPEKRKAPRWEASSGGDPHTRPGPAKLSPPSTAPDGIAHESSLDGRGSERASTRRDFSPILPPCKSPKSLGRDTRGLYDRNRIHLEEHQSKPAPD